MSRRLVAGVALVAALAVPGTAAAGLVLGGYDAAGLRSRRATPAAAQKALRAALRPVRLPVPAGKAQVSRFARRGVELWSLAYVLPSPRAASVQLHKLRRAVRSARRARIGAEGYTVARKRAVVVLWRRRNAVGELLLAARAPPTRAIALGYAAVVDRRMDQSLDLDAWQRTLDGVRPNGRVPRQTALGLFALAYAPLPGTRRPPGPAGRVDEGTLAAEVMLRQFPTLGPAQQAFVLKALGLSGVRLRSVRSTTDLPGCEGSVVPDAGLQSIVDKIVEEFSTPTRLGKRLKLEIVVGDTNQILSGEGGAKALADALPIDDKCRVSNDAKVCRIRLTKTGQGYGGKNPALLEFVLAHEVFHCFEFSIMTPEGALNEATRRNWLLEGMADWAALTVRPVPWGVGDEYQRYLDTPSKPLFERTYDAAGFFGHLEDSTGDLWARIPFILQQPQSAGSFVVGGANTSTFLNSWSSSTYNQPDNGFEWTMTLPLSIPEDVRPATIPIVEDASVEAKPYTLARYEVDPDFVPAGRPLLHLEIGAFARLRNDDVDTTSLLDAYFCLEKRCECPKGGEGSPPPAPPLGDSIANLALSAGEAAASGDVIFESLDQYCKRRQKPPPSPPRGGAGGGGGTCGGCGGSNGDPHLHTFDNRFYDFQDAGEFVLARSLAGGLELQARQEPFPGRNDLSINTAFALRVVGDRVGVYRGDPLVVRVNGRGFLPTAKPKRLPRGGTIRLIRDQVVVRWPDGTYARVLPVKPWGINLVLRPAATRFGSFTGLLGNFNGTRGDDWVTRQGRRITLRQVLSPNGFRLINRVLGDSWRVRPRESLFDYGRGQSTRTFTIRGFPRRHTLSAALRARQRAAALRACKRLHIKNPQILADCTLDVGATGDNRFATGSREFEQTAGTFTVVHRRSAPPPPSGAESHWTAISKGGGSNIVVPSLREAGGKVVVGYLLRSGFAEAATFSPSVSADVSELRRAVITSGWGFLGNPYLIPRAGGGLQVLLSGIHSNNNGDPLNGTSIAPRNPDGSYGPPAPASTDDRAEVDGPGALAPDGQPIWGSTWHGGLFLARGAASTTIADLSAIGAGRGAGSPAVGRDSRGRYWLAWDMTAANDARTGLYLLQFDPATLQPIGSPQLAPSSRDIGNATQVLTVACGKTCRLVYLAAPNTIVSWAYGEPRATVVVTQPRGSFGHGPAAAFTTGGRLWTVWWNDSEFRYEAALGDATGAGGKPIPLAHPPGLSIFPGVLSALTSGNNLVIVLNWGAGGVFSRYVDVIAPP